MPVARFQMPDGRVARFEVPEGTTPEQAQTMISGMVSSPDPLSQTPALSPEQIAAQTKRAAVSSWRGENPVKAGIADFTAGASGLMRGGANLVSPGLGERIWPTAPSADTWSRMAGSLADPVAWGIAGGIPVAAGKAISKLGPAASKVADALSQRVLGRATQRAASGAAAGGAIGALSEEGSAQGGAELGAALNVALPPIMSAVPRAITKVKQAVYPTPGSLAVKAAGDKYGDVINALKTTKSDVPGVNLTAGQASVPANSAEFAALQKLAADKDPSRYFGPIGSSSVKGGQEAARLAALRTISKTPDTLEDAIRQRSLAAKANYGDAFDEVIKRDPELRELWKNPYFKDEVGEAWKIARARGLSPRKNLTEFLHFVKEGLDARIQSATRPDAPAISKAAQTTVQDVKSQLVDWLGTRNPAYESARLEHIRLSKPINQMKLGQEIERALVAPITEAERGASFGGAVRKAEQTISKATGRPRVEDLTPAQRKVIDALESDLKRNANYKELAQAGASNLETRIGAPHAPPTGWFQPMVSAARSWLNSVLGSGHEKALARLSPLMSQNPQDFAQLMQAATPQQRAVIESLFSRYVTGGSIVGGAPQPYLESTQQSPERRRVSEALR
ncbi:MAG: hypothetical protein NUV51_03930 [Sulfuricaulis sp.]|nr:hypothetical protein [Sulfuricaulis sp.]